MSVKVLRHVGDLAVVEPPGRVPPGFALAVRPPGQLVFLLEDDVERETAIRDLAQGASQVVSVDDRWRFVGVAASLGVSLAELLEEADPASSFDPLVVALIGHAVAVAVADINATCDAPAARIVDSSVWLPWNGKPVHAGPFDTALHPTNRFVTLATNASDLALLMRSLVTGVSSYSSTTSSPAQLYELTLPRPDIGMSSPRRGTSERGKWEQMPRELRALANVAEPASPARVRDVLASFLGNRIEEAQQLLAGTLAHLFPRERARDLEWQEELFIEDITDVDPGDLRGPSPAELVHRAVVLDDGLGPPLIVTDVVPRSVVVALAARTDALAALRAWAPTAAPATDITPLQAAIVAALIADLYPQFRLPTSAEWDRLAHGGGVGRPSRCGARGFGRVWEWTSTPRNNIVLVRGGRWRNRRELPRIENVSDEDRACPDVGFRLVAYRDAADVPDDWEPRT